MCPALARGCIATPSMGVPTRSRSSALCPQGVALTAMEASAMGSTIVGTYGYMAPEQFRGAAQPASDLYALGATLLFLLSGGREGCVPVPFGHHAVASVNLMLF